jgi:ATP-dependent Clp protease ATP-binding subunit ClpC
VEDGAVAAVLESAQTEARLADDNHVGTEHIVLAILALEQSVGARALRKLGITREVFLAQLYDEDGSSPPGRIPHTPRADRILALAAEVADGSVTSGHILLGVVAESKEWQSGGRPGPHHLREAAAAVGKTLEDVRRAVE